MGIIIEFRQSWFCLSNHPKTRGQSYNFALGANSDCFRKSFAVLKQVISHLCVLCCRQRSHGRSVNYRQCCQTVSSQSWRVRPSAAAKLMKTMCQCIVNRANKKKNKCVILFFFLLCPQSSSHVSTTAHLFFCVTEVRHEAGSADTYFPLRMNEGKQTSYQSPKHNFCALCIQSSKQNSPTTVFLKSPGPICRAYSHYNQQ